MTDNMIFYKVLRRLSNGTLISPFAAAKKDVTGHRAYDFRRVYRQNEWTHADDDLFSHGYGLCVFNTWQRALDFIRLTCAGPHYGPGGMPPDIEIHGCVTRGILDKLPPYGYSHPYKIKFGKYLPGGIAPPKNLWAFGTIMVKSVKLVGEKE